MTTTNTIKSSFPLITNDDFPCLVYDCDKPESIDDCTNQNERYHRIARNALRSLTYGISLQASHLLTFDNFKFIFWRRDPALLKALREELQIVFNNAFFYLKDKRLDLIAEKRMETFISHLLCILPYLDPIENSEIYLPQKIDDDWDFKPFRFEKIDISPQKQKQKQKPVKYSFWNYLENFGQVLTDFLAKIIDDRDRLYAYGLVCKDNKHVPPYLLMMGSHYPSGQGALLNWIYNFMPQTSVGERHDLTQVKKWLQYKSNVRVAGHSKGGTLAMILAAQHPEHIVEAYCLNPALLNQYTARRLNNIKHKKNKPLPMVNVYVQKNDPVFWLGHLVLPGTRVYLVGNKNEWYPQLIAHAHYISGRKSVTIELVDMEMLDNAPNKRDFFESNKEALNWIIFPMLYLGFMCKVGLRTLADAIPQKVSENKVVSALKTTGEITATAVFVGLTIAATTPVLLLSCTYTAGRLFLSNAFKKIFGSETQKQEPVENLCVAGSTTRIARRVPGILESSIVHRKQGKRGKHQVKKDNEHCYLQKRNENGMDFRNIAPLQACPRPGF